jgi:exonuclease VII large subunit
LKDTIRTLSARLISRTSLILERERNALLALSEKRHTLSPVHQVRRRGQQVDEYCFRMKESLHAVSRAGRDAFLNVREALYKSNLTARVRANRSDFDRLLTRLLSKADPNIKNRRHRLALLENRLRDLNPESILEKGYAICRNLSGRILKSASDVRIHEHVEVTLHEGALTCEVAGRKKRGAAIKKPHDDERENHG